jgi:hypothetical protein
MRKDFMRFALSLTGLMFIVIVIGHVVIVAQTAITGDWTADTRTDKQGEDAGKIHISFERRTEHGRNQNGSSYAYEDLQGLTRDQTQNGKVSFRLVREAGTVECEGAFVNGKGSGTFRFNPDQGYIGAMRSRGFDFEKSSAKHDSDADERLLSAALLNVTTALADDLKSVGFGPLDVDDLFKAAIFKVDSKFMAEMKATGFPNLTMEDLVKARIFKVDADFVRQVHEMGFEGQDFEGLIKFRIFKVTPEFLTALKAEGLSSLSAEDVVKCRIFNIDPEFIHNAKASEPNITIEELVQMKIGVRRMKATK